MYSVLALFIGLPKNGVRYDILIAFYPLYLKGEWNVLKVSIFMYVYFQLNTHLLEGFLFSELKHIVALVNLIISFSRHR